MGPDARLPWAAAPISLRGPTRARRRDMWAGTDRPAPTAMKTRIKIRYERNQASRKAEDARLNEKMDTTHTRRTHDTLPLQIIRKTVSPGVGTHDIGAGRAPISAGP